MKTYSISKEDDQRIENDFKHHPPFGDQLERYQLLREHGKALAYLILSSTPKSREQSLALTNLESALFNANAAIARNETLGTPVVRSGHLLPPVPHHYESEQAGGDPVGNVIPC